MKKHLQTAHILAAPLMLLALLPVGTAHARKGHAVPKGDRKFAMAASHGGVMEVELGRLAQRNGASDAVKDFGRRMEQDHTRAGDDLKQVMANRGLAMPAGMNKEGKDMMAMLARKKGPAFDRAYVDGMVKDHTEDVKEFRHEATKGSDPEIKAFAARALPIIEEHLRIIRGIQASMPAGKMHHRM